MTDDFRQVVMLFAIGAEGRNYDAGSNLNVDSIYKISVSQGIWQTVYMALQKNYDVSKYERGVLSNVAMNVSRKEYIYETVETLEKNGIDCCYLKGITVARFYKFPECRISGDTDILIDEKNIDNAGRILKNLGYDVEKNIGNMYHFEARHPVGGLLEVHVGLYQKHIDDMLFKNLLKFEEPCNELNIDGHMVHTLGVNDGLNHLTAHYIKHFISKGVGLRQLLDLLLYMENYRADIDWESYKSIWTEIGFFGLIEKLKGIGVKYLGRHFETYDTENIDSILSDIENGGVFGFDEIERSDFLNTFLAEREKTRLDEFEAYFNKQYSQKILWKIFPNKQYLIRGGYGYAKKGGVFLIIAYIHRLVRKVTRLFERKKSEDLNRKFVHKDRINFMKKIGVLPDGECKKS